MKYLTGIQSLKPSLWKSVSEQAPAGLVLCNHFLTKNTRILPVTPALESGTDVLSLLVFFPPISYSATEKIKENTTFVCTSSQIPVGSEVSLTYSRCYGCFLTSLAEFD